MLELASHYCDDSELDGVSRETRLAIGRVIRENAWEKYFREGWLGILFEAAIYLTAVYSLIFLLTTFVALGGEKFSWPTIAFTVLWLSSTLAAIVSTRLGLSANVTWGSQSDPEKSLKFKIVLFVVWLLSSAIAILGLMSVVAQVLGANWSDWITTSPLVAIFAVTLEFVARPIARVMTRAFLVPPQHKTRQYDRLLLRLFTCAARTERWKTQWHEAARARSIIAELEAAARECERCNRMSRRSPFIDGATRRELWRRSYGISSNIRSHKTVIAGCAKESDFARVAASLYSGVCALSSGDIEELSMPTADVTATSRIRHLARRLFPAMLLFIAAFALPLIPSISESGELVANIRVTLIAAGVLALVVPVDSPTASRIMGTLTKSLTWKEM